MGFVLRKKSGGVDLNLLSDCGYFFKNLFILTSDQIRGDGFGMRMACWSGWSLVS